MERRQGMMVVFIGLMILAAGCLWWFSRESAAPLPVVTSAPASPPTPVVATPGVVTESDAVALSEEAVDKVLAELTELDSRIVELEGQVDDGQSLIALKEKQIHELEAELKQIQAGRPK